MIEPALSPAAGSVEPADALAVLVARAETCLDGALAGSLRYSKILAGLRERLVAGRLQVAVLGQFKRGKSSFLNALLGEPVLPTGVVPLTAIATFIGWGAVPSIDVASLDGRPIESCTITDPAQLRDRLARFVTEEANPHNCLGVARVDLYHPAPILREGVVLIDTPGIGSTLRHNTATAIGVLPECDVGFFVLSADPPITEAELAYLETVRPHVARLFFVLNKIDYLTADERETAVAFLRRSLAMHLPDLADAPILPLSARDALAARRAGDADGVARSGLAEIEQRLVGFLAHEKAAALRQGVATKSAAVVDTALMDVALAIRALELPAEELEYRAGRFAEALETIERQRLVGRDLLGGDRRRTAELLEQQAATLRSEARSALLQVRDKALRERPAPSEDAAKRAIAAAIPQFFEPKLAEMSAAFAAEVETVLKGHVDRAQALVASVRETAATLFEIPSVPLEEAETFTVRREPYWVTQRWTETLNPLGGGVVDRLLPNAARLARAERRLAAEIDELAGRNVENLRWATLQNLDDAFRRFAAGFDARLDETIAATRGAIDAAASKRREHADAARDELARLRSVAAELRTLRAALMARGQ
ncbi:MAG TPA: dynamin family protein [Stellaceae bacterium]|nr:dynamin family protein [Stellaceae bacterium]